MYSDLFPEVGDYCHFNTLIAVNNISSVGTPATYEWAVNPSFSRAPPPPRRQRSEEPYSASDDHEQEVQEDEEEAEDDQLMRLNNLSLRSTSGCTSD